LFQFGISRKASKCAQCTVVVSPSVARLLKSRRILQFAYLSSLTMIGRRARPLEASLDNELSKVGISHHGITLSRIRTEAPFAAIRDDPWCVDHQQNEGNSDSAFDHAIGTRVALVVNRGRIPINDLHKSASEGEGACSMTSAGRSHLPLRGKLGWMTPRTGQKKTGKRNAS
jgi:hypothetical protein